MNKMNDDIVQEILSAIKDSMKDLRDDQREIKQDIKDIKEVQNRQQVIQAEQHLTLVEHTKRSDTNEKHVFLLEEKMENELAPIKKDIWKAKGALGFLGLLLTIVSILAFFHKI